MKRMTLVWCDNESGTIEKRTVERVESSIMGELYSGPFSVPVHPPLGVRM